MDNFKRTDPKLVEGPCALKAQGPEGDSKIGTLRRSQQRREGIKQSGGWPRLTRLRLTQQQQTARADGVGGSDANIILSGDTDRIRDLWLEKRGEASPPDLSDKLPVMLGCWTEPFNRQWFEQLTNEKITGVGKSFRCTRYNWRRCTLDGIIQSTGTIWEAKHTSAFAKPEEVLERYMPQLQHNMAVTGHQQAVLSVIFGNHKFELSRSLPTGSTRWSCSMPNSTSGNACRRDESRRPPSRHRRRGQAAPAKSAWMATTPGRRPPLTG